MKELKNISSQESYPFTRNELSKLLQKKLSMKRKGILTITMRSLLSLSSNIFSLNMSLLKWQPYNFPGHDSSDGKVPTKLNTMSTLRKFIRYERGLGELGIWYDEMQNISSKKPWNWLF